MRSFLDSLEARRLLSGGKVDLTPYKLVMPVSGIVTSLAVATASDLTSGVTTFRGESVSGNDVLVMYTYSGDANLSGNIDADDYFQIDSNYTRNITGYFQGDFNYDGVINGDDYLLIDYTGITPIASTAPVDYSGTDGDDVISVFLRNSSPRISINGVESALTGYHLRLYGKGGNDKIVVDLADAGRKITLDGGDGNDTLWGGAANERIYAGDGDDLVNGNGGRDTIYGDAGNDSIRGGGSSDMLDGGGGYDTLRGDAGNDNLCGGDNPDRLRGSDGNDRLEGGGGRDILAGEAGDDSVFGGSGDDVVHGGAGKDVLRGERDFDNIYASSADQDDFDPGEANRHEVWDALVSD